MKAAVCSQRPQPCLIVAIPQMVLQSKAVFVAYPRHLFHFLWHLFCYHSKEYMENEICHRTVVIPMILIKHLFQYEQCLLIRTCRNKPIRDTLKLPIPFSDILEEEQICIQNFLREMATCTQHCSIYPCPSISCQQFQTEQVRILSLRYLSFMILLLYMLWESHILAYIPVCQHDDFPFIQIAP